MKVYRLYLWGTRLAPLLPERLGNFICDLVGLIGYYVAGRTRRVVLCNLRHALPQNTEKHRETIARLIFKNNMRHYYDVLRVHRLSRAQLDRAVKVYGVPECKALAARHGNKGILLYCGHMGSFSLGVQASTAEDVDFYLVVEPIEPAQLFELIRRLRETDPRVHTLAVSSLEVRQIFRALKQPDSLVCMAIDRDVTGHGSPLTFFGQEAILPTGVAEIALRTGALLVPTYIYKDGRKYVVTLDHTRAFVAQHTGDKAADVKTTAERMLAEVELTIRSNPDQWIATQPIWNDCK